MVDEIDRRMKGHYKHETVFNIGRTRQPIWLSIGDNHRPIQSYLRVLCKAMFSFTMISLKTTIRAFDLSTMFGLPTGKLKCVPCSVTITSVCYEKTAVCSTTDLSGRNHEKSLALTISCHSNRTK